jgi:hypothetical protein
LGERFLRPSEDVDQHSSGRRSDDPAAADKPSWVDGLEESLLLAIGLFALITWIVTIGVMSHYVA